MNVNLMYWAKQRLTNRDRRRDDLLAVPHHPLREFAGAGDVGSGGVPTSRESTIGLSAAPHNVTNG